MKKIIYVGLIAMGCLSNAFAQVDKKDGKEIVKPIPTVSVDMFEERENLIDLHGNNFLMLGWYAGVVNSFEINVLVNRFLPLSNELTKKLNKLIVLDVVKSDKEISIDAKNNNLDLVYTSALTGSQLVKYGWRPIVGRSESIKAVFVVKESSKINDVKGLKDKKIVVSKGSTVGYYAKYDLLKNSIIKPEGDDDFLEKKISQNDLISLLDTDVSSVVMRDGVAKKLIQEKPGVYKILGYTTESIGHVLMGSKKLDPKVELVLKDYFISLTPSNKKDVTILSGLDGYNEKDLLPFKEIKVEDFKFAGDVVSVIKNKELLID